MDTTTPLKFEGSQTGLTVKLTNAAGVTKRVREAPKNFETLRDVIKAQMCSKNSADPQASHIKDGNFSITYVDDLGDNINVSDDEDLITAYEVAGTHMKGNLKFEIKPRAGSQQTVKCLDEEMKHEPKPEQKGSSLVSSSDSSDSSDQETPEVNHRERRRVQKEKRKLERQQEKQNGSQKKCFKKMIKQEMKRQCQQIFNDIINSEPSASEDP